MTELILSDVTRMAGGYCIIGLLKDGHRYKSVRPLPRTRNAWPPTFSFKRGDLLKFDLTAIPVVRPHVEDFRSSGIPSCEDRISEEELLACFRHAEVANSVTEMFGCKVTPGGRHGAHVRARAASRSICGAEAQRLRLNCVGRDVRAWVGFPWGESLLDLPLVDRSWFDFLREVQKNMGGANRLQRLNRYLGTRMSEQRDSSSVSD